jgi:probable F420-dependent oxidoreductase
MFPPMVETAQPEAVRRQIGRVGVWLGPIGLLPAREERAAVRRIEAAGYGAIWFGEAPQNREALSHAGLLLAAGERISVATGIANIWARDPIAAANGADTLNEAYDGRFVLGLGVSHAPTVRARGHHYDKPLATMRAYLDAMAARTYRAPAPERPSPVVLAALRPRMLELARDRTAGAHPYFVPPAHTARARAILGPEPVLAPEQVVVVETDPARAREIGRRHMAYYLRLPNYVNNLRELGFADADFADGGSDRLVDAIVAWGDEAAISARLAEHFDAGADHVAVQAYARDGTEAVSWLERLAPMVLA